MGQSQKKMPRASFIALPSRVPQIWALFLPMLDAHKSTKAILQKSSENQGIVNVLNFYKSTSSGEMVAQNAPPSHVLWDMNISDP